MEANIKTLRADNEVAPTKHEAAIKQLQSSNEKVIGSLRADMEKGINSLTLRMIGMVSLLGVFIAIFLINTKLFRPCLRKLRGGFG